MMACISLDIVKIDSLQLVLRQPRQTEYPFDCFSSINERYVSFNRLLSRIKLPEHLLAIHDGAKAVAALETAYKVITVPLAGNLHADRGFDIHFGCRRGA